MKPKLARPSDVQWGFPFGVDGCVSILEAAEMLGGLSKRSVFRLIHDGKIRRGKIGSRAVVCKRSLHSYLANSEG